MKYSKRARKRGIEPLVAIIILVAVSIAISLALAFYLSNIVGSPMGTRPPSIRVLMPQSYGRLCSVILKNTGSDTEYISGIYINDIPADIRLVFDYMNPSDSRVFYTPEKTVHVSIKPGQSVMMFFLAQKPLKSGVTYKISVQLESGYTFFTDLAPQLAVDLSRLAMIRFVAFTNSAFQGQNGENTGVDGHLIEFDPTTWEYRYWLVHNNNPDGDVKDYKSFVLTGKNGATGTLENPPPPLYEGYAPVITADNFNCRDLGGSPDGSPDKPTSPILVVLNTHTHRSDFNFTWTNMNPSYVDRFVMEMLPRGVPCLDFLVLWEDLWKDPQWWYDWTDGRAYMDEVARVTWMKKGTVRVGVYRCSGAYLHVFFLGNDFVYYKPHGDNWGDTTDGDPNPYKTYWWLEDSMKVYLEIGYEGGSWLSPSGYTVTVWNVG